MKTSLFLALVVSCCAKITYGPFYADNEQWVLLDTFFFGDKGGELAISDIELPEAMPNQFLAIYHDIRDEFGGFPHVYESGWSCQKKLEATADSVWVNHTDFAGLGERRYTVKSVQTRKWYLVLANCDSNPGGREGVGLSALKVEWTNGNQDDADRFTHHFSVDEKGIFEMMIFSLLALMVIIGVTTFFYLRLRKDESDVVHNLLGLLLVALGFHVLSVILQLAHFDLFSYDGVGLPYVRGFSLVLDSITQLVLVGMFICVGRGYVIHADAIRDVSSVVKVLAIYLIAVICLLYWSYNLRNPAIDLYAYQTEAGLCIVVLRLVSMLWFLTSLQRTYQRDSKYKRCFYVGLGCFGAFYFLQLPVITMIANTVTVWNMDKTTTILEQILLLVTHVVWLVLFCKNRPVFYQKSNSGMNQGELPSMGGVSVSA